jgi:quinol monooxygenase YgiN
MAKPVWPFALFLLIMGMVAMPSEAQSPGAVPVPAAGGGAVYVVTYFEAAPAAADAVAGILKQYAAASAKAAGNLEFLALREAGRGNRFAFFEGWRDKAALDAHASSATDLSNRLQADLAAPFDPRPSAPMLVAASSAGAAPPAGAVYVLTHVDVPPPSKDACVDLLKGLTEASRKEAGIVRFDVVQQDSRPNHFTVIEAWRDKGAYDAHITAGHTTDFRRKLTPMSGALYDERLYEPLR